MTFPAPVVQTSNCFLRAAQAIDRVVEATTPPPPPLPPPKEVSRRSSSHSHLFVSSPSRRQSNGSIASRYSVSSNHSTYSPLTHPPPQPPAFDPYSAHHTSLKNLRDAFQDFSDIHYPMYSQSCTLANTPHVPKSIHEIHTLMSVLRKTRDPRGGSGGGGLERYQEFLVGLDRVEKVSWRKGCSLFTRVGLESELEEAINYIRYQQSEAKRHSSTTASVNRHPLLDPLTRLYTAIKKEDGVVDFDLVLVLVVKVHSLSHHHQQGSGSLGGGLWGLEGIAESVEVAAWEALEFGVEGMIDCLNRIPNSNNSSGNQITGEEVVVSQQPNGSPSRDALNVQVRRGSQRRKKATAASKKTVVSALHSRSDSAIQVPDYAIPPASSSAASSSSSTPTAASPAMRPQSRPLVGSLFTWFRTL